VHCAQGQPANARSRSSRSPFTAVGTTTTRNGNWYLSRYTDCVDVWDQLCAVSRGTTELDGSLPVPRQQSVQLGHLDLGRRWQHQVMAELVVVVEILITERNADNAPREQRLGRVLDVSWIAAVLDAGCQATGRPQHPIRGPQRQGTSVVGDGTTIEDATTRRRSAGKRKQVRVTLFRHRGRPRLRDKSSLQKIFRSIGAPMDLSLVRDAGW
jgi:hypothetical protein